MPGSFGRGRAGGSSGGRLALLIAFAIAAVAVIAMELEDGSSARGSKLGRAQLVFDWTKRACDERDIPDLPARAFRRADGRVQITFSNPHNRRLMGRDFDHLRHYCRPVMPSRMDPRPAAYDDHEWIASTYTPDGRTVYALVHNEYRGHLRPALCPSQRYVDCWFNSITGAVSRDGGRTFVNSRPAPQHAVATLPYTYTPEQGPIGYFEPSNIVFRRSDGHYYALLRAESYRDQQRGSCLMRTRNLADPSSWRAWDGSGFNVAFVNPYRVRAAAGAGICRPLAGIGAMVQSLTYSTYFDRYLLVGTGSFPRGGSRRAAWGVYYSLSDDLIEWSRPRLIREAELPWSYKCGDRNPILYPSLIDHRSKSRNFETVGKRAYLYYTQFHYKRCEQTFDRDVMRVPIEFNK